MTQLSTARKLGIIARVAAQQAGRSRWLAAARNAGQATLSSCGRVLRQLWLEVMGFVFLAMASIGGLALGREYVRFKAGQAGAERVLAAACFTLTFAWFGLSSFWRVRKKG